MRAVMARSVEGKLEQPPSQADASGDAPPELCAPPETADRPEWSAPAEPTDTDEGARVVLPANGLGVKPEAAPSPTRGTPPAQHMASVVTAATVAQADTSGGDGKQPPKSDQPDKSTPETAPPIAESGDGGSGQPPDSPPTAENGDDDDPVDAERLRGEIEAAIEEQADELSSSKDAARVRNEALIELARSTNDPQEIAGYADRLTNPTPEDTAAILFLQMRADNEEVAEAAKQQFEEKLRQSQTEVRAETLLVSVLEECKRYEMPPEETERLAKRFAPSDEKAQSLLLEHYTSIKETGGTYAESVRESADTLVAETLSEEPSEEKLIAIAPSLMGAASNPEIHNRIVRDVAQATQELPPESCTFATITRVVGSAEHAVRRPETTPATLEQLDTAMERFRGTVERKGLQRPGESAEMHEMEKELVVGTAGMVYVTHAIRKGEDVQSVIRKCEEFVGREGQKFAPALFGDAALAYMQRGDMQSVEQVFNSSNDPEIRTKILETCCSAVETQDQWVAVNSLRELAVDSLREAEPAARSSYTVERFSLRRFGLMEDPEAAEEQIRRDAAILLQLRNPKEGTAERMHLTLERLTEIDPARAEHICRDFVSNVRMRRPDWNTVDVLAPFYAPLIKSSKPQNLTFVRNSINEADGSPLDKLRALTKLLNPRGRK